MSFVRDFCTVYTCAFLFLSSFINEKNNSFLNKRLNDIDNKINKICIHNKIKIEEEGSSSRNIDETVNK